jgi:hypothetical protein
MQVESFSLVVLVVFFFFFLHVCIRGGGGFELVTSILLGVVLVD